MHSNPVSISLSSYGASVIRRRGQESFLELLAAAGVARVELREELFDAAPDAAQLSAAIAALQLECLYSSPLELWTADGLPDPRLPAKLALARALGAVALKVSLGYFNAQCDLQALQAMLRVGDPVLLVENDQTLQGGRIEPLLSFFQRVEDLALPLGMTFDIGNWQWQAQSAAQAAQQLGRWVRYVHCKAVQREASGRLVAVPPQAADLMAWEALLGEFMPGVVRAVEYPLAGDDLLAVTRAQVHNLARLGLGEEVRHAHA
ncbi:AP endonuclease [Pseudomonas sp. BP8]|uniref:AP endonuclease n=1 Tax=Pseudomonas sp. BP8 TaxID=2817864 RepID=UPI001AE4C434|nr:AP endonuclease [Pseudomonas sp. BP8]MBP2261943.1 sugar phosphate isomerase/epimerase [Pseudomonas sp. BP8]HDS1737203.1 AP endonuclease [Pseudomonas putida]